MKKTENKMFRDNIKCECGYENKLVNVKKYGTCLRCGKTLDEEVKFKYEMYCRLRLWRKK